MNPWLKLIIAFGIIVVSLLPPIIIICKEQIKIKKGQ